MVQKSTLLLTNSLRTKALRVSLAAITLLFTATPAWSADDCDYGPPNMIRTTPNPFNMGGGEDSDASSSKETDSELGSISLSSPPKALAQRPGRPTSAIGKLSLRERLIGARMFMPERMLIGASSRFTVKGKPGMWVAIAMADKDKGAKPIVGHDLRLGPDRKVVSIAKIPESGVAELYVETPIEGDLIGQYLYFEAALWSKPDMSDLELAETVSSGASANATAPANAVMVAQAADTKIHGVNIVPDGAIPMNMRPQGPSLGSGQP